MEKSGRDVKQFSSFGKPLSKGKKEIEIWEVCRVSQMERERNSFCPNKETLTTPLKGKPSMLFKENAQLRQDYLKRSLDWTEENGECKMLVLLFVK